MIYTLSTNIFGRGDTLENKLVEMKHIHKRFPGVIALNDVQFELKRGEVHALLGENGAGKSTLIKVLGGIYSLDEGQILIDGKEVDIKEVKDAQVNGISIIHQELVLVPHMTVAENIFLGREPLIGKFINIKKMNQETDELMKVYGLNISSDELIKNLTIAQQQMVEIIKAISYDSKILVMDEPTSSISDKEVSFLFEMIRNLTKKGVGIIYISHKMSELEEICDRVTILRDGTYVSTEVVKNTTKDALIAKMVGRELNNYYERTYNAPGNIILQCENISDGKMIEKASFELRKGEIIGFAGLVGSGRTELMKCIFGLSNIIEGNVKINQKMATINSPQDAMKLGIGLVPEDRKKEGLYRVRDIRFNSTIQVLDTFIKGIFNDDEKEREITQKYIDMMATKTPNQEQIINNLSGGNQQKVMIGRWLATNPQILILDEPTRGVEIGAKSEIYSIMNQLVQVGVSIIMISSELPEVINMSDRVYVMSHGKVTGCLNHTEVTQERIMALATKE